MIAAEQKKQEKEQVEKEKQMNPSAILKLMSAKAAFTKNHPKFSAFCKAALSRPIEPGTIIEISLQRPGEEPMMANIKVQQEDLDLLESLKGLSE